MPQGSMDAMANWRIAKIEDTLEKVSETLGKLAVLEQRHVETRESMAKAVHYLDALEERVRNIELEMPMLKQVKTWIVTGIITFLGMAAAALWEIIRAVK